MAYNKHGLELPTSGSATAIIEFTGNASPDQVIQLTVLASGHGGNYNQKTYTAKGSTSVSDLEFVRGAAADAAAALKLCIEHANGHNGTILVASPSAGVLHLTTLHGGYASALSISSNLSNCTITDWSGGHDGDPFQIRTDEERKGAPHDDRTGDFTMNHYKNITAAYKHKSIPQVPFSRTMVPIRDPRVVAAPLTSTDDVV